MSGDRRTTVGDRPHTTQLLTIFVASGVAQVGIQLVLPALPAMQDALSLDDRSISIVTTAYLVPSVLLAFPVGVLADRIGRRAVLSGSLVLLGAAGVALAFVDSFLLVVLLRIVQGIGFAALPALTITLVADYCRGAELVRAQGHRFIAMEVAGAILPLLGGLLAGGSYQNVFLAQAITIPMGLACWLLLDDYADGHASDRAFWRSLAHSFRDLRAAAVQASGFLRFFFKFVFLSYLPILLAARRDDVAFIGLALGVNSLAGLVVAGTVGRLIDRIRASVLMSTSLVAIAAGFVGVALFDEHWLVLGFCALASFGDSGYGVLQNALIVELVPASMRGSFVGAAGAIRNFGKLSAPVAIATALAIIDVTAAFMVTGALALGCVVTVWPVRHLDTSLAPTTPADDHVP